MHKILIVDDEKPARDYIAELVAFYIPESHITYADNTINALNRLRAEDYDLLFVDIDFGAGQKTGLELLEEINQMGKQIYSVIISAHHKFEYAVKGIELGAIRYIPKPVDNLSAEETQTNNVVQYIDKPLYKERVYDAIKLYLNKTKADFIDMRTPDGIRKVQINRLLAAESLDRRRVRVYTVDLIIPEVCLSLCQLRKLLPSNFRYIWRNCFVNVLEIKHFNLKSRQVTIVCQNKECSFTASRENMKALVTLLNPKDIDKNEE